MTLSANAIGVLVLAFLVGFVVGIFYAVYMINKIADDHQKKTTKPWPLDDAGHASRRYDDTRPNTNPGPTHPKPPPPPSPPPGRD